MTSNARDQRSQRGRRLGIGAAIALGVHTLGIGGLLWLATRPPRAVSLGSVTSAIEVSSLDLPASLRDLPLPSIEPDDHAAAAGGAPPITEAAREAPHTEPMPAPAPAETGEVAGIRARRGGPANATASSARAHGGPTGETVAGPLREGPGGGSLLPPATEPEPAPRRPGAAPRAAESRDAPITSPEAVRTAATGPSRPRAAVTGHAPENEPVSTRAPAAAVPAPQTPPVVAHAQAVPSSSPSADTHPLVVMGAGGSAKAPVEIVQGDITAVRARNPELAEFLSGVRERVREEWNWREAYAEADPSGNSSAGFLTTLRVRVHRDGSVDSPDVLRSSGRPPFDDEAIGGVVRAAPFAPPPRDALDDSGVLTFRFEFNLDATLSRFVRLVLDQVNGRWRPSPAFRRAGDHERITVAKLLLSSDGVLNQVTLLSSAGIEFLDHDALEALAVGLHLPAPPAAYGRQAGLVPLTVEFHHNVRVASELRVLAPGEAPTVQ